MVIVAGLAVAWTAWLVWEWTHPFEFTSGDFNS